MYFPDISRLGMWKLHGKLFSWKYRWRAGGIFLARAARARARGERAHVRNIPSIVLPKLTVQSSVHTYLHA